MHVRPEELCTYVLDTLGRTSKDRMNEGAQRLNERRMPRTQNERLLNGNEPNCPGVDLRSIMGYE